MALYIGIDKTSLKAHLEAPPVWDDPDWKKHTVLDPCLSWSLVADGHR